MNQYAPLYFSLYNKKFIVKGNIKDALMIV